MKIRLILASLLLSVTLVASAQTKPAGTWWREKSQIGKEAYINGYKAGSHHEAGHDTALSRFGARELVDGLNHFYSDFRNHNISFNDAVFYVADQLSGVPDEKLNAEILKLRAAAVGISTEDQ